MKDKKFIKAVGARIRDLRQQAGLSQEALAGRADVSPLTISNVELGLADPRIGTLHELARALKVPVGEMLSNLESFKLDREHREKINKIVAGFASAPQSNLDRFSTLVVEMSDLMREELKNARRLTKEEEEFLEKNYEKGEVLGTARVRHIDPSVRANTDMPNTQAGKKVGRRKAR